MTYFARQAQPLAVNVLFWQGEPVKIRGPLDQRLSAAGIAPDADPVDAWRRLRTADGPAATIIDLYELAARRRGLRADALPAAERHALARSVMPDIWPHWSVTSGSERVGDVITIVGYDPVWPDRFAAWRQALRAALGTTAVHIEHVGSTSVPGLAAKPIVDVQISVANLANEQAYLLELEAIGIQLRSRDTVHRYFRPFPGRPRDIHVPVCQLGSEWEAEHLRFRDYLRAHRLTQIPAPAATDSVATGRPANFLTQRQQAQNSRYQMRIGSASGQIRIR